jgi:hypothetical protein
VRAPPVSVTCECGNAASVPYRETWSCERCGRRWDTSQIPEAEYTGILRDMRRARLSVIGVALGIAAVFGGLAIFVSPALFMLMPIVLAAWFIVYMPMWRRRLRRRARSLPTWELESEPPPRRHASA